METDKFIDGIKEANAKDSAGRSGLYALALIVLFLILNKAFMPEQKPLVAKEQVESPIAIPEDGAEKAQVAFVVLLFGFVFYKFL